MTDLPQRTREHELAKEAVRAFEGALGSRLTFYERPQPEYGIDGDVEEFDSTRGATGLHFFVQVKGTDEEDSHKALARSIPRKTANYYRGASMPVLMVRYHSPSGQVYVRWFHQYDPYYGRGATESLTFRWRPEDAWDDTTAVRLAAEARAFYAVRSSRMRLPQGLFVSVDEDAGITEMELCIALRKLTAPARSIIEVHSGSPEGGAPWLQLQADALVAYVGGVASATLHFPDPVDLSAIGAERLAREGMVLLALAFERHGQDRAAAELGRRYLEDSSGVQEPDVVLSLTLSMSRSGRVGDALALSERLDDPDDPSASEAAFILGLAPILAGGEIDAADAERYEKLLKLRVKRRKDDHLREAGAAARNLAAFLRGQRKHQKAIDHYRRAAKLDPENENDASYWASLAGSLWLIRSYRASADAYARALQLTPDDSFLIALYGDALLFAGEYKQAAEEFKRFVNAGAQGDDGEYHIKADAVPYLVKRLGIESQQRLTREAIKAFGQTEPVDADGWAAVSLAQLRYDALWGNAWLNLGTAESERGNQEDALMCHILSTFLNPGDIATWSNAISAATSQQEPALMYALYNVGQRIAGPALTELLVQQAESLPADIREAVLKVVDYALEAGEKRRAAMVEESFTSERGFFEFPVGLYRHDLGDLGDDA
jgi:tetratricopeptide (TPR) repeat protein